MAALTGLPLEAIASIERDGSPSGWRSFALWNPPPLRSIEVMEWHEKLPPGTARRRLSSLGEAARLLSLFVSHQIRTIAFVHARSVAELLLQRTHELLPSGNYIGRNLSRSLRRALSLSSPIFAFPLSSSLSPRPRSHLSSLPLRFTLHLPRTPPIASPASPPLLFLGSTHPICAVLSFPLPHPHVICLQMRCARELQATALATSRRSGGRWRRLSLGGHCSLWSRRTHSSWGWTLALSMPPSTLAILGAKPRLLNR